MAQVIIVGGGLAGLSAAHTVLEHGGKVLLLDKNSFLGGNSTKATSGINGALTRSQVRLGIPDSVEKFYEDTVKSAKDLVRPPLVQVLTGNSGSAVEWLQSRFGLDLSLVSRLGGHSFPRTHRGKEKFPGMTITYALMEKLDDIAKAEPQRAKILVKCKVNRLIQDQDLKVIGVEYERDGKLLQEYGPVVLATGGYAADFADDGLIKKYRPDIMHLPTTNGEHSTGDGLKMVTSIGGSSIDMEKVQIHPTGLVDPNEPDAKVKFLAAEALRGVGGMLLNKDAERFCDELGTRDYVTGEMWKNNKAPYRLVLNSEAGREIEWHCKHYVGRGLMKRFDNLAALAADMKLPVKKLEELVKKYNEDAKVNKDAFGKKYFQNMPVNPNEEFYVSIVTPVVHYCMGGLEISPDSEILGPKGKIIPGLFGAGELCGGVHGANRLGGSSLLGCVVYGRVAGDSASRFLMQELISQAAVGQTSGQQSATRRIAAVSSQVITTTVSQGNAQTRVEIEPNGKRIQFEVTFGDQVQVSTTPGVSVPTISAPPAAVPAPAAKAVDRNKEYTAEEVAKHKTEKDCWVIVNGDVLDVTDFLKDHPGGKKAIMIYAGRDATEEFNMLHKADVVEKYAPSSIIGKLKGGVSHANTSGAGPSSRRPPFSQTMKPSNVESRVSGGTADVLPAERAKATFDSKTLTYILDGSPEATKRKHFILNAAADMDISQKYNWTRAEFLKNHINHFIKVHEDAEKFKINRDDVIWMVENATLSGSLMNHYGLFLPTLEFQASDEQKAWWFRKGLKFEIVGCYAQTELGHGSNVRGLMTVAEFDKNTQEFVLNTPSLRSIKWWPGTLGKIATHAIVYAQLIIDGKEYGVHSFMVQIRDENHTPLSGITLGDLGSKLGDHANDTGFMTMENVRIPREFMLAKFQSVTPQGEYVKSESKKKNAKLHYATMMFTRGGMVKSSGGYLARAVTIAVRYSAVRTQGFIDTKKGASFKAAERPILDYQVQRYRLFRQLAMSYAIKFTGSWMIEQFRDMEGGGDRFAKFDSINEIAATSSGLKALCTYLAWSGIEDCRKCCGGNGYLMSSGIANLAADYVWQTTAEGDWIILMLQTAQFLLKSLQNAMSGKKLAEVVSYLTPVQASDFDPLKLVAPEAKSVEGYFNLDFLLSLFRFCSLVSVINAGQNFQNKLSETGKFDEALNSNSVELITAVRAHTFTFMLVNFASTVNKCKDAKTKAVLAKVCALFACSTILEEALFTGHINARQIQFIKAAVVVLLDQLRPDAVALVDAFDISDRVLNSAIGKADGNVYEALFEEAQKGSLNQVDPFDGYKEYLRPHLDLKFLARGNKVPPKSAPAPAKL